MKSALTKKRRLSLVRILLMCLLLSPAASSGQEAADLTGHWEGVIKLPGMELEVQVDFEKKDDAWTGKISIPMQGANELPLGEVVAE